MKARVDELRRATASVLTCTGTLFELGGIVVDDHGHAVAEEIPVYEGRCLVYPADRDANDVQAGQATWTIGRYVVLFPHTVEVKVGHRFEVLTSPDSPDLVGTVFRISDAPLDAWAVLRHCVAERIENR